MRRFLCTKLGLNPWLGLPLAALVGGVGGMIIERLVVRPLYARPLDAILATWGVSIILGQLITLWFGRGVQFAAPPITGTMDCVRRVLFQLPPEPGPGRACPRRSR